MRNRRVVTLLLCLVLFSLSTHAQEGDPVGTWQVVVNQARLGEGLAPYGFSSLLTVAAQRHADDVAANGFADPGDVHMGSDGTHEQERAADAGYAAWTWIGGGLIVDENMWSGYGTVEDAMAWFMGSTVHRGNVLSPRYREIGIGVATDADGRSYHVLVFGVRPNVLPIFANDGAASTDSPEIAIRLTNEEARPDGEGATFMGRAIEVRISDEPRFDDLPWQPWDTYVSWTLPATPGEHTVYVQFRDAAGRTAASPDSIVLSEGASGTAEPVLPPTSTPEPTATPIPPSATPEPTATPVPTSTPTVVPTMAPTPELVVTVEPTATPALPPTPVLSRTPATGSATPFPTWTPLPTPAPQESGDPDLPLGVLAVLQGMAIVFGIYLALRRGRGVARKRPGFPTASSGEE